MRSEFYEHLEKIEAMYEVSGVQSVAVNAYMNSILSTGLRFKRDGSPARGMVLTTVLDWIKNLCLYGFCCFRVLVDEKPGRPDFPVQVPSGRELSVRFSGSKLRWVPDLKKGGTEAPFPISTANSDEDGDDEDESSPFAWHCIVYQPPTESKCTSFAAQSYDDALRIEELYKVRPFFLPHPNFNLTRLKFPVFWFNVHIIFFLPQIFILPVLIFYREHFFTRGPFPNVLIRILPNGIFLIRGQMHLCRSTRQTLVREAGRAASRF